MTVDDLYKLVLEIEAYAYICIRIYKNKGYNILLKGNRKAQKISRKSDIERND